EAATRICPFDVFEDVAYDPTRATFDATFVGKKNATILDRSVAIGWAAIDALLPLALQANVAVDNPNVGSATIHIVCVKRELFFYCRWVENLGPVRHSTCHVRRSWQWPMNCRCPPRGV